MAQSISPADAHSLLRGEGAGILDVRTPGEFAAGHLPNAVNIPLDQLQERYDDLPEAGTLIVNCASGARSKRAIELLDGNVQCELRSLEGGYNEWHAQGLPVARELNAPWSLERQTMFAAGSLALTGLALGKVVPPFRRLSWLVAGGLIYAGASGNCYLKKALLKAPWNQDPDAWQGTSAQMKQKLLDQARSVGSQVGEKAKELGHKAVERGGEAVDSVKQRFSHATEAEGQSELRDEPIKPVIG